MWKIFLSVLIVIFFAGFVYGADPLSPGGSLNPYVIEPDPYGGYEIKPENPSLDPDPLSPGGSLNPYVIEPDPYGGYEIKPEHSW